MHSNDNLKINLESSSKGRFEEPLSPSAIVFVRSHSAHILVTMGFTSPLNPDSLRAQLPLALNHPRFSSLMVGDWKKNEKLKWVQVEHVNIDDHIIVPNIDLVLRNNCVAGDEFVEDYLHNLTKTSIDYTSKPPWEFHFLDIKTSEAESIWIFRIHHALGDGISITSHLLAWTRQVSKPESLPTLATMKKNKEKKVEIGNKRGWKLPLRIILSLWWWLQVLCNTIVDLSRFFATTLFLKDSDLLIKSSPDTDIKRRRIVYTIISLVDMKSIKNAMNVSINDVALGIIEAGFSRHLNRKFANKDGNNKEDFNSNKFLKRIRLRMAMVVNLRSLQGIQDLDDINNKGSKLGLSNEVGFVILPLSILVRDDPLEYIREAKVKVNRKKRSLEAPICISLCKFMTKILGFKIVGAMTKRVFRHLSICVSNVPGPVEEIAFSGHPIKFIAPTVHGLPNPIMIHFQSCADKMTIVLSLREDVILDPHELIDDIKESFLQIKATTMAQRLATSTLEISESSDI